jgi:Bacterial Ig domain/Purple acid Phosphatase, N-terminal domain/Abnormal spindle-like microcephaly-assoc'd, ASPM-SPD-2-Hydin
MRNPRAAVTSLGLALVLLLASTPGAAGILDATWTVPTTHTDGTPLTDLASYRVYYGTSGSPCAGSAWTPVSSPTSSPTAGQRVSARLSGLTTGASYNVAVSAIDAAGNESPCSNVASAVSRSELAVSPAGSVSFGTVTVGSFAEQSFTVSNTSGGTIAGSASVGAPFSVVSGTPFTLAGQGTTQTVRVRFSPTVATTVSTTLTFAAAGGTLATILTGVGAAATPPPQTDATPPTVAVTAPVSGNTVKSTVTISASAGDNVGVAGVQFQLDGVKLGAEVTTQPYTVAWNTTAAADGTHVLTAVARDAAGNVATSVGVSVSVANAAVADTTAPTISGITTSVTASGAVIGWTTNEPGDTQVEYGLTKSYGAQAPLNAALQTSHTQTIGGLKPGTWYHFRVRSRDAAGNLSVSRDFRFKTSR